MGQSQSLGFSENMQPLKSFLSWLSYPSPGRTPRLSSGPGSNPPGPLHVLVGIRPGLLMTIRFKICFQLDRQLFCSSPIPLQVCQEANKLSHSWTRSPAASRAKATEREEMSSSHREALKAARQPTAPGRPGKGPPRSQLCPLCSCHSLEGSALRAKA